MEYRKLNVQTIEFIRDSILGTNEITTNYKSIYRSYSSIVSFFTFIGLNIDKYQNESVRILFVSSVLNDINGTESLIIVLKNLLNITNFDRNIEFQNKFLLELNRYLAIDKYNIELNGLEPVFKDTSNLYSVDSIEIDINRIWGDNKNLRLFISHTSKYKIEAKDIKDLFAKFNITCFVAHEDITPTKEWVKELQIALFSMDYLITINKEGFSSSVWTNQEIGIAIGRQIPIISLKYEEDPPGFTSFFQAIKIKDIQTDYFSIIKLLMNNSKMIDSFIELVKHSKSFDESNKLSELFYNINNLNSTQTNNFINNFNSNSQVYNAIGFSGFNIVSKKKTGESIINHLNKITGKNFIFNSKYQIDLIENKSKEESFF